MARHECVRRQAGPRAAFGLVLFLALIGLGAHLAPAGAQTLFGTVVRIVDGDTIHVQLGDRVQKVRYIGMNTPETHHPTRGEEPGGREATEVNRQLVEGQRGRLELDAQARDQYRRLLAYVWVGNVMVNAELVRRGYAQVMTIPPERQACGALRAAPARGPRSATRAVGRTLRSSRNGARHEHF